MGRKNCLSYKKKYREGQPDIHFVKMVMAKGLCRMIESSFHMLMRSVERKLFTRVIVSYLFQIPSVHLD